MNLLHPVAFAVCMMGPAIAFGDEPPSSQTSPSVSPTVYCGLHCVHAAAQLLGVDIAFESLVDLRFLRGRFGSSADDLMEALRENGLDADGHRFLPLDYLRSCEKPVILLVRPPGARQYSHWILFHGVADDGRLHIYDPPRETGTIPVSELLSIWGGTGIVVHGERRRALNPVPLPFTFVGIFAATAVLLDLLRRRLPRWLLAPVSALILAAWLHVASPSGLLRSPIARSLVALSHFEEPVPEIDFDELQRRLANGDCRVIDARLEGAYRRFHLPDAESLPVDASLLQFKAFGSTHQADRPVVVYCQSEHCGWAQMVARRLRVFGVQNVVVFPGGVAEWQRNVNLQ